MLHSKSRKMFQFESRLILLPKYVVKSAFRRRFSSITLNKLKINHLHHTAVRAKSNPQQPAKPNPHQPTGIKDLVPEQQELVAKERMFKQMPAKDKTAFLKIIEAFGDKGAGTRGQVQFIYAAMRYMEEFNVQHDLEVYKKLMDVFPKGKMIAQNLLQAEFHHFPRHQDCGVELLDLMEMNAVCPDKEMREIVLNIFGKSSHVFKKISRMRYWMPKMKNKNPYLPLEPLPSDTEELARLALRKMSVDPRTKLSNFKAEDLEDSIDKTWIVSAQSPVQQKLLLEHPVDKPLYAEGAYLVWLRKLSLSYFILRTDPPSRPVIEVDNDDVSNMSLYMFGEPKPAELVITPKTVHEQDDAMIFAMCATGTSSKDSVLSWIRFLRKTNPVLDNIPIVFTLKSPPTALTTVNASNRDFEETDHTVIEDQSDTVVKDQSKLNM